MQKTIGAEGKKREAELKSSESGSGKEMKMGENRIRENSESKK